MRNIINNLVQIGNIWSLFFAVLLLQFPPEAFIMILMWGKVHPSGAKWWI